MLLIFTSCNSKATNTSNNLENMQAKYVDLQNENNALKQEINNLKNELENVNLVKNLEHSNVEYIVEASKVYFKESTNNSIDGGCVEIDEEEYYLEYESKIFISTDFIKKLYNTENDYGIVIKGFPVEKYIINTNGILYVSDYYEELQKIYDENNASGNYNYITKKLDGLEMIYGEVGLRKYIITKPLYMTQRGITVGSTKNDVIKAYGILGNDSEDKWHTFVNNAEYSRGSALTFMFDANDRVTEIQYGWK